MSDFRLASAGNVMVPAFLVLREKGFAIRCERTKEDESWFAEKPGLSFIGDGPLELLGLVALYEARGTEWKAPDDEIEAFLAAFDPP